MPDVFISYSRKDGAFAKRLNNTLTALNRDVWIDWEDIPRGENWLNEIYSGIEAADTFLLIVSEHSLTSEICALEISHARHHNKRIVPVIRQQIEGDVEKLIKGSWMGLPWEQMARDNWTAIRHINWVDMHDDAAFDAEFALLTQTLDDDLPHRKAHTRYLVRALEWERGAHNPSYLLSGDEIDIAEGWLSAADNQAKLPPADEVHRRFISESRRTADARAAQIAAMERRTIQFRRAAIALGVVGLLALTATVIAGISTVQVGEQNATAQAEIAAARAEATAIQRDVLQANADLNASRAQQAVSRGQMGDALRFALQAAENRDAIADTAAVHQSLLDVLSVPVRETASTADTESVIGFELSPDRTSALLWTANGTVSVRALPDLTVRAEAGVMVEGAAWSTDGSTVVMWSSYSRHAWHIDGNAEPAWLNVGSGALRDVTISPDGDWAAFDFIADSVTLVALADPAAPPTEFIDTFDALWLPDGRLLLVGGSHLTMSETAETPESQTTVAEFDRPFSTRACNLTPDFSRIACVTEDSLAWSASLVNGSLSTLATDNVLDEIDWSPDGSRAILWTRSDDLFYLWDGLEDVDSRSMELPYPVIDVIWNQDSASAVLIGDSSAYLTENDNEVVWNFGHRDTIRGGDVSADHSRVLTWSDDKTARIWDLDAGRELITFEHLERVLDAQFSPDERHVLTVLPDESVRIWPVGQGEPLTISHGSGSGLHTALWADNSHIVTFAGDNTLRVWSLEESDALHFTPLPMRFRYEVLPVQNLVITWESGVQPWLLDIGSGMLRTRLWDMETNAAMEAYTLSVNESGTHALVVPSSAPMAEPVDEISLFSLDPDDITRRIFRPDAPLKSVRWNVTGTVIAGLTVNNEILIYPVDPETPVLRRQSPIDATFVAAAPDGKRVIVWNSSGSMIIDVTDPTAPGIPIEIMSSFEDAFWSPDGNTLLIAGFGNAEVWNADGKVLWELLPFLVIDRQFSADGSLIALRKSSDNEGQTISIYNVEESVIVTTHSINSEITNWDWSPDGSRLMIVGADGSATLVPANGGTALTLSLGGSDPIASFSPDGKRIYSVTSDGVQVWTVDFDTLISIAGQIYAPPDAP